MSNSKIKFDQKVFEDAEDCKLSLDKTEVIFKFKDGSEDLSFPIEDVSYVLGKLYNKPSYEVDQNRNPITDSQRTSFRKSDTWKKIKQDLFEDGRWFCHDTGFKSFQIKNFLEERNVDISSNAVTALQVCHTDRCKHYFDDNSENYDVKCRGGNMVDSRPYLDDLRKNKKLTKRMIMMIGSGELIPPRSN